VERRANAASACYPGERARINSQGVCDALGLWLYSRNTGFQPESAQFRCGENRFLGKLLFQQNQIVAIVRAAFTYA
jgi:hypothetical protein